MSELLYQTLRESVVNAIRTKIMNHQIRPGERIVEMELAHEFQTSRGPIREALRQLENEGIVEYTRNVGCSVRTFSFWDSYEVYLLRTNYEAVSVRLLNGKVPEETIQKRFWKACGKFRRKSSRVFLNMTTVFMNNSY